MGVMSYILVLVAGVKPTSLLTPIDQAIPKCDKIQAPQALGDSPSFAKR